MGVSTYERMNASTREQALSMSRRIDLYLSDNMPDLIDKHDLATKRDMLEIKKKFQQHDDSVDELTAWKESTTPRIDNVKSRIEKLEKKNSISVVSK